MEGLYLGLYLGVTPLVQPPPPLVYPPGGDRNFLLLAQYRGLRSPPLEGGGGNFLEPWGLDKGGGPGY